MARLQFQLQEAIIRFVRPSVEPLIATKILEFDTSRSSPLRSSVTTPTSRDERLFFLHCRESIAFFTKITEDVRNLMLGEIEVFVQIRRDLWHLTSNIL